MQKQLRRTKIIATLGPSTDQNNNLEKIIASGANIVRLNFSHGNIIEHLNRAQKVRKIASKMDKHIAIIGDLQGPKIRISTFKGAQIYLQTNDILFIDSIIENHRDNHKVLGVNYKKFAEDVIPGDILLLDDGKIQLQVLHIKNTQICTKIIVGGLLYNNKGINKLGGGLLAKALTKKDKIDIITAAKIQVDYLAVSFPYNSNDLNYTRKLIFDAGSNAKIISKIERAEVVASDEAIDDIIKASDAVMIARGDLGIEIGNSELMNAQKKIVQRSKYLNRAVIIATQMMESMVKNIIPTRAEVMDVANAVLDGADAVMLSAETALGQYPSKTVSTMANICLGAEKNINFYCNKKLYSLLKKKINKIEEAISIAAIHVANHLEGVSAIVILTKYGNTISLISRINSILPIFVLSKYTNTLNMVTLYKGVIPIYFNNKNTNVQDTKAAGNLLRDKGYLTPGTLVVIIQEDYINTKSDITNISYILKIT